MRVSAPARQRGLTTFVAMIFLLLLLLFAISAVQILGVNLRITSNMQSQKAVEAAAQQGLERMISDLAKFITPPTVATTYGSNQGCAR